MNNISTIPSAPSYSPNDTPPPYSPNTAPSESGWSLIELTDRKIKDIHFTRGSEAGLAEAKKVVDYLVKKFNLTSSGAEAAPQKATKNEPSAIGKNSTANPSSLLFENFRRPGETDNQCFDRFIRYAGCVDESLKAQIHEVNEKKYLYESTSLSLFRDTEHNIDTLICKVPGIIDIAAQYVENNCYPYVTKVRDGDNDFARNIGVAENDVLISIGGVHLCHDDPYGISEKLKEGLQSPVASKRTICFLHRDGPERYLIIATPHEPKEKASMEITGITLNESRLPGEDSTHCYNRFLRYVRHIQNTMPQVHSKKDLYASNSSYSLFCDKENRTTTIICKHPGIIDATKTMIKEKRYPLVYCYNKQSGSNGLCKKIGVQEGDLIISAGPDHLCDKTNVKAVSGIIKHELQSPDEFRRSVCFFHPEEYLIITSPFDTNRKLDINVSHFATAQESRCATAQESRCATAQKSSRFGFISKIVGNPKYQPLEALDSRR